MDIINDQSATSPENSNNSSMAQTAKRIRKKIHLPGGKRLKIIIVVIILAIMGVGYYIQLQANNKLKQENQRLSNPQEAAKAESDRIKADVAKLIELPSGETPTIASVVDASKLKSQAFFANAQNGDKVLLFAEAKKAILYRPSTGKIIEVAPINIGDGNTQGSSTTQPTSTTNNKNR